VSKTEITADRLSQLSSAKRELLEKIKRGKATAVKQSESIPRRSQYSSVPASFGQKRLWFLDQLIPGLVAYNIPAAVRAQGFLNFSTLQRSLNEIALRHETLRTTFAVDNGQPVQLITPSPTAPMAIIDLRELPETISQEEARQLIEKEIQQPFNLSRGPLWSIRLFHLGDEEYIILIIMHHIISDAWSLDILVRELSVIYSAYLLEKPSPLPELPIQYADFVMWQQQWLQGEVLEKQLSYWKNRLSGTPTVLELATDKIRPIVQTFGGAIEPFMISMQLAESLKTLGRRQGSTLFMVLLAAFETLLYRYSGQPDFLIGSPIAGRTKVETEDLIGFFANTLALRAELSGNPSFLELLSRVRETTLEAYANQEIPFEKLVEELHPTRDTSRNPLFQVMFVLQNTPESSIEVSALKLSNVTTRIQTAKFDLWLSMAEGPQTLGGVLEYKTDLFSVSTIQRLLRHFTLLLEDAAIHPERPISDLTILMPAEREQLITAWNDTEKDYPGGLCLHELFDIQARRTPSAIAISFGTAQLSFNELSQRSNQLAHYLQMLSVGPDVIVGLLAERSLEMVVALLGILKAGGAYLPLDPSYPPQRLALMLSDAGIKIMIQQESLAELLPQDETIAVTLERDWGQISRMPATHPINRTLEQNLAYVIYTSGSTGKPKGVMISHEAIRNRLVWMQQVYQLTTADHVLQKTSFAFDVSIWEFFWPLLNGARLVLATPEGHRDTGYLVEMIKSRAISTLHFVPSMLKVFLQEEGLEACDSLKRVICSGEALTYDLQEQFFRRLSANLHNLYGPTEASIDVTAWICQREGDFQEVPIGFPIANTQTYILDRNLELVPAGIPGELQIGGINLCRGYLNRPELTGEKLIPNTYGNRPGSRLYRTGDLANHLPDGSIKFLGRIDDQVKIRGFRIEPQEIETLLGQHSFVAENVVVAWEDWTGKKRLVAYVVPVPNDPASECKDQPSEHLDSIPVVILNLESELRQYLKDRLPDYMIPSSFVILFALPLLPNGKVDRKKLPPPDRLQPEMDEDFRAARTPLEQSLAAIWAQVLGLERVGVHNNFFELGGDSIGVMQVVIKSNQAGLPLSPIQIFQYQTIAELAPVVTVPLNQDEELGLRRSLPLTPIQYWFFERGFAEPDRFSRTAILELSSEFRPGMLEVILEKLHAHHDSLRLRFELAETGWRQVYADPSAPWSLTYIDISEMSGIEQQAAQQVAAAELSGSLNLVEGPLARLAFLNRGKARPARLLICIHCMAADCASWQILLQDLNTAFLQLSSGESINLQAQTVSFGKWAHQLIESFKSPELQQERDACPPWQPSGSAANAYCEMASEPPTFKACLGRELTDALVNVSPVYKTEINDVLLMALAMALRAGASERSILIEVEADGRDASLLNEDLSRTVGCLKVRFPLLLEIDEGQTLGETIKQVKRKVRNWSHKGFSNVPLRWLGNRPVAGQVKSLSPTTISFTYLAGPCPFGWSA